MQQLSTGTGTRQGYTLGNNKLTKTQDQEEVKILANTMEKYFCLNLGDEVAFENEKKAEEAREQQICRINEGNHWRTEHEGSTRM